VHKLPVGTTSVMTFGAKGFLLMNCSSNDDDELCQQKVGSFFFQEFLSNATDS
jgi:hypothetical protein